MHALLTAPHWLLFRSPPPPPSLGFPNRREEKRDGRSFGCLMSSLFTHVSNTFFDRVSMKGEIRRGATDREFWRCLHCVDILGQRKSSFETAQSVKIFNADDLEEDERVGLGPAH